MYALIHDSWIAMMSNFLIAESRRNDVITRSFDLWTLYCRIDNFLLMLVVRRLADEKKERFMFRRRFLEIDLVICRYHVFAWLLWLLMSRSEYWLSWKDRKADDSTFLLRVHRWKMIWLSDWWLSRTSKRFWLVDESHDVHVRERSAEWSLWTEKENSRWRTMKQSRWTTVTETYRKC